MSNVRNAYFVNESRKLIADDLQLMSLSVPRSKVIANWANHMTCKRTEEVGETWERQNMEKKEKKVFLLKKTSTALPPCILKYFEELE